MIKEGKEMVSSVVPREASGTRGEAESKEEGLVSEPAEHRPQEAQGRTPLTEGSASHRGPSGLPTKSSHRGAGVPVLCREPLQWRAAGLAVRTPLPAPPSSPPPPPLKNGGPPRPGQQSRKDAVLLPRPFSASSCPLRCITRRLSRYSRLPCGG